MKKLCLLTTIALIGIVAAGCGSDDDSSAGNETGADPVRVYVLLPSLESESYVQEKAGADAAAESIADAEVTVDAGTSRGEATNLISKIETAITQGYDAIAVNPGAVGAELAPVLQRANQQGIKIVTFDQTVPDFPELSAFVEYNGRLAGELMGQYMAERLPEGGVTGAIDCFSENPLTQSINDGIDAALEGTGVSVVQHIDAQCDPARSRSAAENLLAAHPDMLGIFGGTDIGALGAVPAVQGEGEDFVLIGGGAVPEVLDLIVQGAVVDATTTFPFERFGREAVETAVAVARGEEVPKSVVIDPELVTDDNAAEVVAASEQESTP